MEIILKSYAPGIVSFHKELIHLYYQHLYRRQKLRGFFIGIASLYLIKRFSQLFFHLLPKIRCNLINRYGEHSWAVVTGGSDGVGKEFCFQLAKEGFNVAIIARNEQKMDDICIKLQEYGVQTKILVVDFSEGYTSQFYEKISAQLEQLDISILVNNVGMSLAGPFASQKIEDIYKIIRVNALSTLMMTKVLSKRLEERPNKSAVITISSGLALLPCPNVSVYSSTKAFTNYFSQSLGLTSQNIDYFSVTPLGISTKMLANKTGKQILSTQQFVKNVLHDVRIGKKASFGSSIHQRTITYLLWKNQKYRALAQQKTGEELMYLYQQSQQQQKQQQDEQ